MLYLNMSFAYVDLLLAEVYGTLQRACETGGRWERSLRRVTIVIVMIIMIIIIMIIITILLLLLSLYVLLCMILSLLSLNVLIILCVCVVYSQQAAAAKTTSCPAVV